MAGNWRIRHKLMLGMGLVMAIMALLLAGTLKGLASYQATMRTMGTKLAELNEADALRDAVKELVQTPPGELSEKVKRAEEALHKYHAKLADSVSGTRGGGDGYKEESEVDALEAGLAKLQDVLKKAFDPKVDHMGADRGKGDEPIRQAINTLLEAANDLLNIITGKVRDRIAVAKTDYKVSFAIVMTTNVIALLMMAGLLRFFYRSMAHPIRDLERGVGRVAKGDFEHRIAVHSGDEIEDLAEAFNDMTGRLREMYRDLAQQVNERSRQLVRSERLAGVGFLAAGVAHEINNPLASIAFCGEALERRLADLFESRQGRAEQGTVKTAVAEAQDRDILTKYLKMIQDEAFRCKKITQKLLEFSRGGEHRREQTDLGELVQIVLDMVQHLPSCKGKEIIFQPAETITAWVNSQELQQVLLNLVVNALESMDDGGRLTISQRQRDGMAELVFKDSGCGMTGEVLENIFEPFFTRSRTGKGTGLGLSISHRIITQHGGDIEAASDGPNLGSTFTVRLPMEPPAMQHDEEVASLDPETEFLKLTTAQRERKAA